MVESVVVVVVVVVVMVAVRETLSVGRCQAGRARCCAAGLHLVGFVPLSSKQRRVQHIPVPGLAPTQAMPRGLGQGPAATRAAPLELLVACPGRAVDR